MSKLPRSKNRDRAEKKSESGEPLKPPPKSYHIHTRTCLHLTRYRTLNSLFMDAVGLQRFLSIIMHAIIVSTTSIVCTPSSSMLSLTTIVSSTPRPKPHPYFPIDADTQTVIRQRCLWTATFPSHPVYLIISPAARGEQGKGHNLPPFKRPQKETANIGRNHPSTSSLIQHLHHPRNPTSGTPVVLYCTCNTVINT